MHLPISGFPTVLREPTNYYHGINAPQRPRSSNLITFLRTSRESLQQRNFANRSHHRHVLTLVLQTAGSIIVDGTEHRLSSGQAFYVKPFQFHHYLNLHNEVLRWFFITFDLEVGAESMGVLSHQPMQLGRVEFSLWQRIINSARKRRKADQGEALPLLDTLLYRLLQRHDKHDQASGKSSWIARAEGLVVESVDQGWTVEEVGQKLGLSGRHLRSRFETEMGISIREYRANYQLHRAISLMQDPHLAMGRIAELCGFNSQAVFNRFIKRQTDKTPRELHRELLA